MKKKTLCPNCRKPELELYAGWTTGNYQCRKCGYLGPLVLEEVKTYMKSSKKKAKLFSCSICGLKYKEKPWAKKCRKWCSAHKSCNLEIAKHAIKATLK